MTADRKSGISGFTIVRNARLLDYPFVESVRSVLPLCDEFIINCGDSSDDTAEICEGLVREGHGKVKLVHSVWDLQDTKGGSQLRAQTDTTMAYCREKWCLYIQADEAIHEDDHALIRRAITAADRDDSVDGIVFDYLHFYASYEWTIRGRNWYRREVRAFKNDRGIAAFRDAQGFRRDGRRLKAIHSGARVFHYGYVRTPTSLQTKSNEMAKWWGGQAETSLETLRPRRHVGLRRFTGSHPAVMRDRIGSFSHSFDPASAPRRWDKNEIKNALTLLWEAVFPFRLGEFRNYDLVGRLVRQAD